MEGWFVRNILRAASADHQLVNKSGPVRLAALNDLRREPDHQEQRRLLVEGIDTRLRPEGLRHAFDA
jgi:hypothetical protein